MRRRARGSWRGLLTGLLAVARLLTVAGLLAVARLLAVTRLTVTGLAVAALSGRRFFFFLLAGPGKEARTDGGKDYESGKFSHRFFHSPVENPRDSAVGR